MNSETPQDYEHDFTTRVISLLRSAMVRRDADAHRRGWFFEAADQRGSGYRVIGHRDDPSITLELRKTGALHVLAIPGSLRSMPLRSFDAERTEAIVAEWWEAVRANA